MFKKVKKQSVIQIAIVAFFKIKWEGNKINKIMNNKKKYLDIYLFNT